jgi:hypothetical protein
VHVLCRYIHAILFLPSQASGLESFGPRRSRSVLAAAAGNEETHCVGAPWSPRADAHPVQLRSRWMGRGITTVVTMAWHGVGIAGAGQASLAAPRDWPAL